MKQKILLDCTATLFSGLNTGIQRVVRNVIRRHALIANEFNVEVVPVVSVMGRFYEVDPQVILRAKPITASVGAKIKTAFERFKRWVLDSINWHQSVRPFIELCLDILEWFLKKVFWFIKFLRVAKTVYLGKCPRARAYDKDVFVFLDAFWLFDFRNSLKRLKAPRVVCVIYDLVPIYHPDYVEEGIRELFRQAMPWMLESTQKFLCISKNVSDQISNYCSEKKIENKVFDYFLLGSDFVPKSTEVGETEVRSDVSDIFRIGPVWLTVGTIEPRKNHQMVLDAFDLIWKNGGQDVLLIVGRIGWKCEHIVERISKHPLLNKRLFFKWDLSDTDLQFCYNKSQGLIFASFAEGFGLPLVEAMASKIKVVCSDIPIFREIGKDYPLYFDLSHPDNLVATISKAKELPPPQAVKWLTWDESVLSFAKKSLQD